MFPQILIYLTVLEKSRNSFKSSLILLWVILAMLNSKL